MKSLKVLLIGTALTAGLTLTASAEYIGVGTVSASALNMREGTSTSTTILATAPRGSSVLLLDEAANGWYKVSYNGLEGYMSGEYLDVAEAEPEEPVRGMVNGSGVRLRSEPNTSSTILGHYYTGTSLEILDTVNDWYQVLCDGQVGYIRNDLVIVFSDSNDGSNSAIGQSIVDHALTYLGLPYRYGGSSPSTGFDCSGFVYYLYRSAGFSVNRTASTQWYHGIEVSKDELQPGDLVFFSNNYSSSIEHVGIYVGDGMFIHSPSTGDVVKLSSLNSSYYLRNYYGARRIIGYM